MAKARKHDKKKRSAPVMWSFVLTLLLIAAISAALGLFQTAGEPAASGSLPEPVPVGTPAQAPTVDRRPAPPAASEPAGTDALPGAAAPGSGVQDGAASAPNADADAAPPEGAGQPETAQGVDAKDGEQVVRGVILYATTSSVTIQTADGTQLSFLRETADVTGRLVEEAEVEVYYIGSISGTDTSAVFVTKIVSFA